MEICSAQRTWSRCEERVHAADANGDVPKACFEERYIGTSFIKICHCLLVFSCAVIAISHMYFL
jgi:hypothetical protein